MKRTYIYFYDEERTFQIEFYEKGYNKAIRKQV